MKEALKDMATAVIMSNYIEKKESIDELINKINDKFNELVKEVKPKNYEDKLGVIMTKIEFLENILMYKKFKKDKKDALKIFNLYLEQVKELEKLWE